MKKRISSKPNAYFVLRWKRARNWPKAKLRKFKENLFQPVDALPLGIFRFLFGFLLCIEFLFLSRGTFPYYYIEPVFHFTYPLFDLLGFKPLSKPFLWLIFNALQISTVGIMLGRLTRICFIV